MQHAFEAALAVGTSVPFLPSRLSGLVLWLAADRGLSLADDDPVATWPDQSGNGNDATQATEANKPLFKVNILNGKPVLRFDGVSGGEDHLKASGLDADPAAFTALIVARSIGAGEGNGRFFNYGDASDYNVFTNGTHPNATFGYFSTQGAGTADLGGDTEAWSIVTLRITDADTGDGRVNGGTATSFDPGPAAEVPGDVWLGASSALAAANCDIAEVVVYDRALTDDERQQVESYLSSKYGIALA